MVNTPYIWCVVPELIPVFADSERFELNIFIIYLVYTIQVHFFIRLSFNTEGHQ